MSASILIYAMEDASGWSDRLRGLFGRIDRKELLGVTSELTLAEVLVKPIRDAAPRIRERYEALLDPAGPLSVVPVSRTILVSAAELRATKPALKLPDALHAATALAAGCGAFLTNDARFACVEGLPVVLLSEATSGGGG